MRKRLAIAIGVLACGLSSAQDYPSRAINFITPGTPGSTSDITPRVMAEELSVQLGRPVVVVNRAGGSGLVSANAMLAAPPDGHTIWLGTMGVLNINPYLLKEMPFDPRTAVTAVAMTASFPLVLVINPKVTPASSVAQLVQLAKSPAAHMTYGSAGAGSSPAIAAAIFAKRAGVDLQQVIYKGFGPAIADVLGGRITMMVPDVGVVRPNIQDGSLRPLAVTSARRSELLPDVPSLRELGYDVDVSVWTGVFVRSDVPKPYVERLAQALRPVMRSENVKKRWTALGLEVGDLYGEDFARYYQSELKRWGELIPPLGIPKE